MPKSLKNVGRSPSAEDITLLLSETENPESLWTVMQWAYAELHRIAVGRCRSEAPGHTLSATALLNEACVRLFQSGPYKNRRHFFGAASKVMRRILTEGGRRRHALKRGGNLRRVDFSEAERIGFERPSDLLDFDVALTRLAAVKPLWSEVAELRVFGGWKTTEIATILGCGESTARSRWAKAKKWLASTLANSAKNPPTGGHKIHPAKSKP